jgi:uncharacterized protein HemY
MLQRELQASRALSDSEVLADEYGAFLTANEELSLTLNYLAQTNLRTKEFGSAEKYFREALTLRESF